VSESNNFKLRECCKASLVVEAKLIDSLFVSLISLFLYRCYCLVKEKHTVQTDRKWQQWKKVTMTLFEEIVIPL
jgi:hypothetical protein